METKKLLNCEFKGVFWNHKSLIQPSFYYKYLIKILLSLLGLGENGDPEPAKERMGSFILLSGIYNFSITVLYFRKGWNVMTFISENVIFPITFIFRKSFHNGP